MRAILISLIVLMPVAAFAQGTEGGRFILKDSPEGLLRMDSKTGQVSLCTKGDNGFACRMVPDDRTAMDAEIQRLTEENLALKQKMGDAKSLLPDQEIDRAIGMMGKMMRAFRDIVREEEAKPKTP